MTEQPLPGNIILTGVPRSGTTMACRLLSGCADVVALNEPMYPDQFLSPEDALDEVADSFTRFRNSLLHSGTALARTAGGEITDNAYSESKGDRTRVVERGTVHFDKPLSPVFRLIMKHCAEFSLLLPELAERFPVFALIRNPLATLGSWASVHIPVSRGKVAKSARLDPALHADLEALPGLLEKQIHILDWYFRKYLTLDPQRVIRYEDIVHTGGEALSIISGTPCFDPALRSRNRNTLYDPRFLQTAGNALLERDGAFWSFYRRDEVRNLLDNLRTS